MVQNIFYVQKPPEVSDVYAQLETEKFSTNGSWIKLKYSVTHNNRIPVFQTSHQFSNEQYYHYKLKVRFYNDTWFEAIEWRTITIGRNIHTPISVKINCTTTTTTANNALQLFNDSTIQTFNLHHSFDYTNTLILFLAIVSFICLTKILYFVCKNRCKNYFDV